MIVRISRFLAVVVMTSLLWSQTAAVAQVPIVQAAPSAPAASGQPPAAPVEQTPPVKKAAGTVTIPSGTAVPLTMVTEIRKSTMKTGGPVRAQVMFPITVGSHIAIPTGTFVDGTIAPVASKTNAKTVYALIHFTQLTFANGYTAPLVANATSAMLMVPGDAAGVQDAMYGGGGRLVDAVYSPDAQGARFVPADEYCPGAPYPCVEEPPGFNDHPGPNPVVISLAVLGGFLLMATGLFLLVHHANAKANDLLMTGGTQMQMTLQQAVTLDAAKVAQAAATGSI